MDNCVFCNIVNNKQAATLVKETKNFIVIKDIRPASTTHLLIITKKHFTDLNSLTLKHNEYYEFFEIIKDLGKNLIENHYKIQIHTGKKSGQEVFHFHTHFISSSTLR